MLYFPDYLNSFIQNWQLKGLLLSFLNLFKMGASLALKRDGREYGGDGAYCEVGKPWMIYSLLFEIEVLINGLDLLSFVI